MTVELYRQARDVLSRRGKDRWCLLAVGGESVFVVMGTGVDVWEGLEQETTIAELAGRLAARFGAGAEAVHADVLPVVDELRIRGLVAVSER